METKLQQLTVDERIKLVEDLWDSIAGESAAASLNDAQRAELDRRFADHEANPNDVVAWEDVKASIATRLKR